MVKPLEWGRLTSSRLCLTLDFHMNNVEPLGSVTTSFIN
jgi:hypothetical protein